MPSYEAYLVVKAGGVYLGQVEGPSPAAARAIAAQLFSVNASEVTVRPVHYINLGN